MLSYSVESDYSRARYGRLNLTDGHGWCSRTNSVGWLQLDLGETFEICGVATQGGTRPSYQVATFKLMYSNGTEQWRRYLDTDGSEMVMFANFDLFCWFLFRNISSLNLTNCFESFSPLGNVWIDRQLMPSSNVIITRKPGGDFDWLIV